MVPTVFQNLIKNSTNAWQNVVIMIKWKKILEYDKVEANIAVGSSDMTLFCGMQLQT